ncbi:hypothetical protein ACFWZ2_41910 [Streptomyces sp. NPDC059002]|uniref:hypothetical protein n=1 Tax=Streptomyces sp. NPDC059002 TaxID=3346690 RepID=UPI0036B89A26
MVTSVRRGRPSTMLIPTWPPPSLTPAASRTATATGGTWTGGEPFTSTRCANSSKKDAIPTALQMKVTTVACPAQVTHSTPTAIHPRPSGMQSRRRAAATTTSRALSTKNGSADSWNALAWRAAGAASKPHILDGVALNIAAEDPHTVRNHPSTPVDHAAAPGNSKIPGRVKPRVFGGKRGECGQAERVRQA